MAKSDVARLLALIATFDQRTIGEADIEGWHLVARVESWTVPAAQRVIVEHVSRGADRARINPALITDRIRAVRRGAAATFQGPRIPDGQPTHEYPEWYRRQMAAHVDALVYRWATSGEEPPAQLPTAERPSRLGQRRIAELTAGAFRAVPSATPSGQPPTTDGMQARSVALATPCPYCDARPAEPCTRSGAGGRVRLAHPHPARAGQPATAEEAS